MRVIDVIRSRVVTWNLGAQEPFGGSRGKAPRMLGQMVPSGYDVYVVALQEAVSDDLFDAMVKSQIAPQTTATNIALYSCVSIEIKFSSSF